MFVDSFICAGLSANVEHVMEQAELRSLIASRKQHVEATLEGLKKLGVKVVKQRLVEMGVGAGMSVGVEVYTP